MSTAAPSPVSRPRHGKTAGSRRKTLQLSAADLADLNLIRSSPNALAAIEAQDVRSEAAVLQHMFRYAAKAARIAAEEAAYEQLADSYANDPEEAATIEAVLGRNRVQDES